MTMTTKPFLLLLNVVGSIALGLGISYYASGSSPSEKQAPKASSSTVNRGVKETASLHSPLATKNLTPETSPTATITPSPTPTTTIKNDTESTPTPTPTQLKEKSSLQSPTPTTSLTQPTTTPTTPTATPTEKPPKKEDDRESNRSLAGEQHNAADTAVKDATRGKVSLSVNVSL